MKGQVTKYIQKVPDLDREWLQRLEVELTDLVQAWRQLTGSVHTIMELPGWSALRDAMEAVASFVAYEPLAAHEWMLNWSRWPTFTNGDQDFKALPIWRIKGRTGPNNVNIIGFGFLVAASADKSSVQVVFGKEPNKLVEKIESGKGKWYPLPKLIQDGWMIQVGTIPMKCEFDAGEVS